MANIFSSNLLIFIMKHSTIIITLLLLCVLYACKKENKINKNMVGTWEISEIKNKNTTLNDFSAGKRTLQFFKYKKAYTKTMEGIYRVDYTDSNKAPIIDTFEYQLKDDEFDVTKILNKKTNGVYNNTFVFLKRRFKIEGYKTSNIKLARIDSTDLYIKITK
jgi:hypothetical protein